MTQQTPIAGQVKMVAKCSDCSHFVKNIAWTPGTVCPKCKSRNFGPVTLIAGALDYSIADRSKGYAIEDIRFAKIALWAGVITATQYNDALSRQKAIADRKEAAPHIGRILVDTGAIRESDMEAILEVRCKARPTVDDKDFAKLAVGNKYCTEQQMQEVENLMAEYKRQGRDTPPIAFLLLEKRYIKENQAQAIIKSQQKRRLGIMHDTRAAIEERKPLSTLEHYVGVKGDPKRTQRIVMIFGGLGGLLVFWLWYMGVFSTVTALLPTFGPKIGFYCEECGGAFMAREAKTVPIACYVCGKKSAIYGFHCARPNCGMIYGIRDRISTTPRCPRCKSGKFADLTSQIIAEAEAKKKPKKEGGE